MRARLMAGVAVAALAAWLVPAASPAEAREGQVEPGAVPIPVVGNFVGDAREEMFAYWTGATPDMMVRFGRSASGAVSTVKTPFRVSGTYTPLAGNFDGDGYDEIIWYARGTAPDYLWDFTGPSSATSRRVTVNGTYQAVTGDFTGDGTDDVMWYDESEAGRDYLWDFNADGTYGSVRYNFYGPYELVAGSFGTDATDDILLYAPLGWGEILLDFQAGSTSFLTDGFTVNGFYEPRALDMWGDGPGGSDIFWYGWAENPDYRWDFVGGNVVAEEPDPVNGMYSPVVTGDLFADGSDDIVWIDEGAFGPRRMNLWDHDVDGTTLLRHRYAFPEQAWAPVGASTATGTASSTVVVDRR